MTAPCLILASSSPRRRDLLAQIGIPYLSIAVDIHESQHARESVSEFVVRMAVEKAQTGRTLSIDQKLPVLAADTIVAIDNRVLGKPGDRTEGLAMLSHLAGRTHRVLTAVAVVNDVTATRLSVSRVTMGPLSQEECASYWDTGEGCDKAGAYAIQGRGGALISCIEGSYSGIVGLPLFETRELLNSCGIDLF